MQKVAKMKLRVLLILPREGLKKTGYVITEDSRYIRSASHSIYRAGSRFDWSTSLILPFVRSRLGGQAVKPVSTKLNFGTFLEHYQAYSTAQVIVN